MRTWYRPALALLLLNIAASVGMRGDGVRARGDDAVQVDLDKLRKVKCAYLLNFAKFVTWPADAFESAQSPFRIGIIGRDPFESVLDDTMKGRRLANRQLTIQRLGGSTDDDRKSAARCQILYVGDWRSPAARTISAALKDKPVLLVGEGSDLISASGGIGFVVEEGRVVFYISRRFLAERKLDVSSQLLKVARIVDTPTSRSDDPPSPTSQPNDPSTPTAQPNRPSADLDKNEVKSDQAQPPARKGTE